MNTLKSENLNYSLSKFGVIIEEKENIVFHLLPEDDTRYMCFYESFKDDLIILLNSINK